MLLDKAYEIFQRAKEKGYLPKQHSMDSQEKKDAVWIVNRRQTKKGKGYGVWYQELDDIAKQYGFPNAFDRQRK